MSALQRDFRCRCGRLLGRFPLNLDGPLTIRCPKCNTVCETDGHQFRVAERRAGPGKRPLLRGDGAERVKAALER